LVDTIKVDFFISNDLDSPIAPNKEDVTSELQCFIQKPVLGASELI
jgi:hypothetical protein